MRRTVTAVADLLAPPRCLSCSALAAPVWCRPCRAEADRLRARRACERCGLSEALGGPHACWPEPSPIGSCVSVFDYAGPVARAVVAAKVRGARTGWPPLGALLGERLAERPPEADVVAWVPTDPRRRRRRGVDHAAVLAATAGRTLRRPVHGLLVTAGAPEQGARPSTERSSLPLGTYRATRTLPGARVLLVDDVLTTGATAHAAATALRGAGAATVVLAVLARAGQHPLAGR